MRPWIRRFTMIISAWWRRASSKFSGQEFKEVYLNTGSLETLEQVRIPPSSLIIKKLENFFQMTLKWQLFYEITKID